jgi:hypothetical protein
MTISDLLQSSAVAAAVHEFDRIGRDGFLAKYGFGKAREYFLKLGDKLYDSKAIVGAAHGYQYPERGPLKAEDFSGGEQTVRKKLEDLGYVVIRLGESRSSHGLGITDKIDEATAEAEQEGAFDPTNIEDARRKALASIVRRRGQREFRSALLEAYEGRCAITGCNLTDVLEAAHIYPYKGDETNDVRNGLLLRADIHTLFDLGLVAIDAGTRAVLIAPRLRGTAYEELSGKALRVPKLAKMRPSNESLDWHRREAGL